MTQPAYSRLPRERRVADIMAAARAVFDEKGYAAGRSPRLPSAPASSRAACTATSSTSARC